MTPTESYARVLITSLIADDRDILETGALDGKFEAQALVQALAHLCVELVERGAQATGQPRSDFLSDVLMDMATRDERDEPEGPSLP